METKNLLTPRVIGRESVVIVERALRGHDAIRPKELDRSVRCANADWIDTEVYNGFQLCVCMAWDARHDCNLLKVMVGDELSEGPVNVADLQLDLKTFIWRILRPILGRLPCMVKASKIEAMMKLWPYVEGWIYSDNKGLATRRYDVSIDLFVWQFKEKRWECPGRPTDFEEPYFQVHGVWCCFPDKIKTTPLPDYMPAVEQRAKLVERLEALGEAVPA